MEDNDKSGWVPKESEENVELDEEDLAELDRIFGNDENDSSISQSSAYPETASEKDVKGEHPTSRSIGALSESPDEDRNITSKAEEVHTTGDEDRLFKRNTIEAALFIAARPLTVEELSFKLNIKKSEVAELIEELAFIYMERVSSIYIVKIGDAFAMQLKPEYIEPVKRFASGGLIPEAIMRTLTVIALKQPITKAKLIKMRGQGAYQHVKYLVERGLVESEKKGRSSILTTTDQFAEMFGLSKNKEEMKRQLIRQLGIESAKG